MNDFGGKLRQARERRGISLRQIAASTKISAAALDALERNDVSKLPGGIFSRAFVRSYAVEVGLDPDETVKEFLERFHGEPPPSSAIAAPIPEEESAFESQQRMAGVVLKLLLMAIPVAGVILYFTLRSRPAAAPQVQPSPRPAAEAPAVAAPAPPPVVATEAPASAPAGPPATPRATSPMRLEIHPTGACWVSLTIDGQLAFSRVMQAGERDVREVRDSAEINVGDAGAFAFSIDGRPGRALGEAGQVKSVRLTRDTMASLVR
jgi:cytoskeletal protein RodZ